MSIEIVVTTAGRAALVNAENTGTDPVTITEVGFSATAVTPLASATTLPGEFKRIAGVAGEVVAADTIHINTTDTSTDAYSLRSIALYLADGTLFAIYGQADPLVVKTASSIAALAIDVIFADISAALLTFGDANFTNPPATTERQGVIELATLAEAAAGIDALRALTPASAKAAILGWLLTQDGSGSGLDADLLDGQDGSYYANIAARLGYTPVNKAGDTMGGLLTLAGAPTANLHAATKIYVDAADALGLLKAGGTMTGLLTLSGDPTAALHAVTKQYLDALVTAAALKTKLLTVDGSGSGLDADLLDGQDGSYYSNIAARLGFTPVNKAGDTMTGFLTLSADPTAALHAATRQWVLAQISTGAIGYTPVNRAGDTMTGLLTLSGAPTTNLHAATKLYVDGLVTASALLAKLLTVDGSGSGLDADLLDGQDSAYYANIAARLGYTPVNKAGDTMSGLLTLSGDPTANLHAASKQYADTLVAAAALLAKLLTVDGSGCGLDADLLDGRHASAFMLASDATTYGSNANGYWEKRANGIIEQRGIVTGVFAQGAYTRTYPIPFPAGYTVIMNGTITNPTGGTSAGFDFGFQVKDVTTSLSTFDFVLQDYGNTGTAPGFHWHATGYPA